jgi:crotonobetainyl-CoA:carnitine CoA-transferase CaiB-like acyl-CoA transferase
VADAELVARAVSERIATRTAAEWAARLEGLDACCSVVATLEEALSGPIFAGRIDVGSAESPRLPLPLAPHWAASPRIDRQ